MLTRTCDKCGKELTEVMEVPCPDNIPDCPTFHCKFFCNCEDVSKAERMAKERRKHAD
jgi:hypothetical protein